MLYRVGRRLRRTPNPAGQQTSIGWTLPLNWNITAGGAGGGSITYEDGLADFRADFDSLVTTANGAVSALTSAQSLATTWSQAVSANRPVHDSAGDYVRFDAASATDTAAGDFLAFNNIIPDAYRAAGNTLGVAYILFRITATVAWTTWLFRVGVNNANFSNRDRRAYHLGLFTGPERIIGIRGNTTANVNATFTGMPAVNELCALAFVLNDSRTAGVRNGASDNISRIFLKTKAGGTYPTLQSAASSVLDTSGSWSSTSPPDGTEANLLRLRHNNSATVTGFGKVDIHTFGFDRAPPITNADIEAVLDTMLTRV